MAPLRNEIKKNKEKNYIFLQKDDKNAKMRYIKRIYIEFTLNSFLEIGKRFIELFKIKIQLFITINIDFYLYFIMYL